MVNEIETCADCGNNPERMLDGVPFGGYDRPLCPKCAMLENARIDRYIELYGSAPSEDSPDFRKWMELQRISGID